MDETDFIIISNVVKVLGEQRRDEWIDIHNLRAQKYGNELHIDCHLTLPNYFDLNRVHEEVKLVEKLVNKNAGITNRIFYTYRPMPAVLLPLLQHAKLPHQERGKKRDIPWTMDKVMRNKKHYE
jgi:hypothetical protein